MKEVIEHFGIGFLELAGGIGIVSIMIASFSNNGITNSMITNYFCRLCG